MHGHVFYNKMEWNSNYSSPDLKSKDNRNENSGRKFHCRSLVKESSFSWLMHLCRPHVDWNEWT